MSQFLQIFSLLSVLLRAVTLAFEALAIGGVIFLLTMVQPNVDGNVVKRIVRWIIGSSLVLALTQIFSVAASSMILIGSTDMKLSDVAGTEFWTAGILAVVGALVIAALATAKVRRLALPLGGAAILYASLMSSHAASRLEHSSLLMAATLVHHVAADAWIGGLPYLLIALRHADKGCAGAITRRFSTLAMVSVATLVGAGVVLSWFYVGSSGAMFGTTYGAMLSSKVILTGVLLIFGALNLKIVRAVRTGAAPELLPLSRFAEAEVGIGFTVLLAAASLTSTPPAIDVVAERVSYAVIAERMQPRWPRMDTPAVTELSPATPLSIQSGSGQLGSFLPGQVLHPDTPADIAWSEYNHHWAGLIVFLMGTLAILSRRMLLARHWPVAFFGLAVFLLVRADSENWPLGPRGFWESFQVPEVAQHRFFVLLIVVFAVFECGVQTKRIARAWASLVFPGVCAVGGAMIMTHSHSLGNVKEEFLAELSHLPLAILAVLAGWSRWLEIRLPFARSPLVAWIWPACFVLIGTVLLLYRES